MRDIMLLTVVMAAVAAGLLVVQMGTMEKTHLPEITSLAVIPHGFLAVTMVVAEVAAAQALEAALELEVLLELFGGQVGHSLLP
jgi:hypothetical protein